MKRVLPLTRMVIIPLCFVFLHYGNNASKVAFTDILWPVIISIFSCCLFFVILQAMTKSSEKSILLSGIFFFMFFNFDNFTSILMDNQILFTNDSSSLLSLQKTRVICLILLGIIFGIITFLILITKNDQKTFKKFNVSFSIGMIIVIISSVVFEN